MKQRRPSHDRSSDEETTAAGPDDISVAAGLLQAGELVAFPTETVYGLGADATNDVAVLKIFQAKGRPSENPIIVHLADSKEITRWVSILEGSNLEKRFQKLDRFWPGPLTIVFPQKTDAVSSMVTAGKNSVAIRIPNHPIAQALLKEADRPIAAPSANRSSYISATSAEHVRHCFGQSLTVLDGGSSQIGIESTIIALSEDEPVKLLRHGAITTIQLQNALGEEVENCVPTAVDVERPESPGQYLKHYSPVTNLKLFRSPPTIPTSSKVALVTFSDSPVHDSLLSRVVEHINLGSDGDLEEAAHHLYAQLRRLDELGLDLILVQEPPMEGIGQALADRLFRAAQAEKLRKVS